MSALSRPMASAGLRQGIPSERGARLRKALLCTLGPSSMDERVIADLEAAGATSFRINMSHTELADLEGIIRFVQRCTDVPLSIDTEGAQIRTGRMRQGTTFRPGDRVRLVRAGITGGRTRIPLAPGFVLDQLIPGARMSLDFDAAVLRIDRVASGSAEATVLIGGEIGSRKAVSAFPSPRLPSFSEKDLKAIAIADRLGVREYDLSFCEDPEAIARLRSMVEPGSTVIAKIESREGVRRLWEIALSADRLLIDRGDLSREVRLEALPLLQKAIIRKANALGVPIYVATNLLESMVGRRVPTRAEVNDVINTVLDGADGLVLAAETAIGQYPVEAARMIGALLKVYEGSIDGYHIDDLLGEHPLGSATLEATTGARPRRGSPPGRRR